MKLALKKQFIDLIESGVSDTTLQDFALENLTIREMTELLVETMIDNYNKSDEKLIRISRSDFDAHFRIIGFSENGEPETREVPAYKKVKGFYSDRM